MSIFEKIFLLTSITITYIKSEDITIDNTWIILDDGGLGEVAFEPDTPQSLHIREMFGDFP
jgi:hypothetical protein